MILIFFPIFWLFLTFSDFSDFYLIFQFMCQQCVVNLFYVMNWYVLLYHQGYWIRKKSMYNLESDNNKAYLGWS